jgi:UDPglucose 6-dehydrogenase
MSAAPSVAIVGLWHQGVVAAACLADWGYDVVGADFDAARIGRLQEGKAPLFEPGLDDLLGAGRRSGRLTFTTDLRRAVDGRKIVLLMHDTPVSESDQSDLTEIIRAVEEIAPGMESGTVLHVTAQVPVGTCDEILRTLASLRPGLRLSIAYSPENLRLGQALERFRKPPLPVLGSDDPEALDRLERFYAPCGVTWQRTDLRTAEMVKHALNTFLALSVTFANELGNVCDEVGADGHRLAEILRLEPRVGSKALLFPGLGFAGGTLARDVQTLRRLGVQLSLPTPLLDGLWQSNKLQNGTVVRRILRHLGSLHGRKIAVWGLTYKPDTSTLRRSAALEVIAELHREGAVVTAHDPKADRAEVAQAGGFSFAEDPLFAAAGADALVLMTPWAEYRQTDFDRVRAVMAGSLVFDTAGLWKAEQVAAAGLEYLDIGRGRRARRQE